MKVVILAGGKGSRLASETARIPKPMIRICGQPLLWHIIYLLVQNGLDDFLIATGYRGDVIRDFFEKPTFSNRYFPNGKELDRNQLNIQVLDTGLETNTAGRVLRTQPSIGQERFLLTWGDGVSDIDIGAVTRFHLKHGRLATLLAVHPPAKFGHLSLDGDRVTQFVEKPIRKESWINGGLFVLEPGIFDYIDDDTSSWEYDVLPRLAKDQQLMAYRHEGFWQCMDTIPERDYLETLCQKNDAPWLIGSRGCVSF